MSKINGQIQKFWPYNKECVKSESSIDCGLIFPKTFDIDAAFYLGAVVWGPFFKAVELSGRTAHEHYMNTKI